ncbi:MAG: AhpC/TSA family, partial [Gaiellaceae bacterium]|nr:AhpC/TSA family [Gaiellaceae bacterium]
AAAAGRSLGHMISSTGTAAPALAADVFVRGEQRRRLDLSEFRGTWVVLAFAARPCDVLELAGLEEAFAADGAVVLAATHEEWREVENRYGTEQTVRFPILIGVGERRRITAIVDPDGVVRHAGPRRSARETLGALETQLVSMARAA